MLHIFRKICGFFILPFVLPAVAEAYTITYNLMGGVNHPDNPTSYESVGTERLPWLPPTREGYSFLGWYLEASDTYNMGNPPNKNISCEFYKDYNKSGIAHYLGNFTVYARWGLVPKTPQKDERGCYLISTAEELYGIRNISTEGYYHFIDNGLKFDGCISLQKDIVVNKNLLDKDKNLSKTDYAWWFPLRFSGTFEGNGHKISGLRGEQGLFSELGDEDGRYRGKTTIVRNLGIEDSYFQSTYSVGGIAGEVVGPVKISNVYTDVSIHGKSSAGGIVGYFQVTNPNCPDVLDEAPSDEVQKAPANIDYSRIAVVENTYSLSFVEGREVGGITAAMDASLLRNVYFAGTLRGEYSDCIVLGRGMTCYSRDAVFEVENALCLDSKDTSGSHANVLNQTQFADGTALDILSKGENGYSWTQKTGEPYPHFDGAKFGIRYVLNGGVNDERNPAFYVEGDKSFALQNPRKENDVFEGWFTDSAFTQKIDSIKTENLGDWTVYAKWKSFFVISRELNGGTGYAYYDKEGVGRIDFYYGKTYTYWSADSSTFVLEEAYREGYNFEGWYLDSQLTTKVTEIPAGNTEDVTVYAKWSPSEYKITYHLNGGTNNPDNPTSYKTSDAAKKLYPPTREGAIFMHWAYSPLYDTPVTEVKGTGNVNLYAVWIPVPQKPAQDASGCYLLTNRKELYWFAGLVDGTLEGVAQNLNACAILQNDIVVNENATKDSRANVIDNVHFVWYPISDREYFRGKFLGNGHSIYGLLTDDSCPEQEEFAGLFCRAWNPKDVIGVTINDSHVRYYYVNNVTLEGFRLDLSGSYRRIALPKMTVKSGWRVTVNGNNVALSGLVAGKPLLVMDVQGRILRRLTTESSMVVDMLKSGRYLIHYGNETRAVVIR